MAFVVQNDTGDAANANAYIDADFFKSYCDDRAYDFTTAAYTDNQIQQAIVRATDYLDTRFAFLGVKLQTGLQANPPVPQTTQWPRKAGLDVYLPWWDANFLTPFVDVNDTASGVGAIVYLTDNNGQNILGVPQAVKEATAEYAWRALSLGLLFQDMPAARGGRLIRSESITVDTITRTREYEPAQAGSFMMPAFPMADLKLARAGLIQVGRTVMR